MKIGISMIDSGGNNLQVIIISTTISIVILSLVITIGGWIFWKNKQKNRYELIQIQQSKS
jgi:TM2 domain-containing membrane protein YozV